MSDNRLTDHFTLNEFTRSALALRHGIANEPAALEIVNMTRLARHVLEPVRQHFGRAFSLSSGYRSPQVNALAGSKLTSQHVTGHAADFEIPTIANRDLADWIKANLVFDQLILEFHHADDPKSGWVHCSYRQQHNRQNCLIFNGTDYKEF